MTVARRLLVSGRVQGVWYRDWMVERATAIGAAGWVRNLSDGRVEAFVEGEADAVDALIAAAREGPPRADVTGVAVSADERAGAKGFARRGDG